MEINTSHTKCVSDFSRKQNNCIQTNKKLKIKANSFNTKSLVLGEKFMNKNVHIPDENNIMGVDLCIANNNNKIIQFPI